MKILTGVIMAMIAAAVLAPAAQGRVHMSTTSYILLALCLFGTTAFGALAGSSFFSAIEFDNRYGTRRLALIVGAISLLIALGFGWLSSIVYV